MTRAPAKPMTAPGSAMAMSPSMAKEAETPPVVGSVMSDRMPSCMRAPPEEGITISGASCSTASRAAASSPSPTAMPMEPPMKAKLKAAITVAWPPMVPVATMMASFSPVLAADSRRRSP
jgi:hypothetical protein